jgi:hypothetical protein
MYNDGFGGMERSFKRTKLPNFGDFSHKSDEFEKLLKKEPGRV